MTTFSTEFLSHTLNFRNHPNRTSRRSNPNTIVTSSTPGNTNNRRTRIRVNETRPKLDQDYDEALIRSFKSAKYNRALRFLKRMVDRGYKPDAILCTKLINGFFNSKKTQKAIRVMEILEKHGQADVFAYEALLNGYCKADIVDAANKVSSAWLLYKSSTAGNGVLSATLQGFSVFDDREGVEQGFRLAIGKPESIGASPPSTLSYYENQESIDSSLSKGNNFEPVQTMLIVDMKFGPDSTFVSVCIQRPQLLVALDFLLAVVEFFVPTVSSMLSFEEHNSSMLDAIIINQSIYKQPCAEFSLSPQKPLIVDDENFDHFIYDGDGGILYLKDGRGLNLTSASSEAIIYIGNGKKLQFRNVFIKGGQHLDSCVFLGANNSYSALNDDHVYLEQSVESPQAISPRGSVHEVPSQNNAANSSAEVIVELQVNFYDIKNGCVMVTAHAVLEKKLFCIEWKNQRKLAIFSPENNSWTMVPVPLTGSSSVGFRFGVLDGKLLLFPVEKEPTNQTLLYDPNAALGSEWQTSDIRPSVLLYSRPSFYDGLSPVLNVDGILSRKTPPRVWLNFQYQAFYDQHDVKLVDKVLEMLRLYTIDFISSPEIGFLTSVNEKVRKKTKFVFQFLNASDVEPTTMQPYGTIVKDLAAIKSYASGIIVPKEYIWPVKPDNYFGPLTTLVSDAHKQGLEVYASGFANDFFSSYDYNYDPTVEYLQFIAKDECVDGLVTDFLSTASNSIGSTNLAYQQAIDDGADIIDCSVQMTKDGISFCSNTADLMADTTAMTKFMSRTSNVPEIQPNSGIFSFDLTWNEIQSLQRNASV
ncbi:hypothetical protein RYX36_002462 [Vicia faba]